MKNKSSIRLNVGSGMNISMVVFIVFLILKLTKAITWSWWWITSPLWIPLSLGIIIIMEIIDA